QRIVRGLGSGLEREAEQVRPRPADPPQRLISLGTDTLPEAAIHRRVVLNEAAALNVLVHIVSFAAGRQSNELQRAVFERARDVAAELDHGVAVGLNEIVVVLSTRARRDAVALEKVEAARLPASVEVQRLVRGALELPGRSKERILVEIAVVLAPVLEELARRDVSK